MTEKKKTAAAPADGGLTAAEVKAQLERDADRHKAREADEAAKREAEAKARRAIAVLDADRVLVGKISGPTDAEWDKARPECRFPNGFDNALHRYTLEEWKPGRFRFEPIMHDRDAAKENSELLEPVVAPLVRVVLALASDKPTRKADLEQLADYLKTFDAQGA